MLEQSAQKVKPEHLSRRACLYVRQSSLHQVRHHTESTRCQYDLRHRARALGWANDCIDVIDEDQGRSGAHATHRTGFRDLLARVAAREVGLVLSLEVSRLCRNNADWHQLLKFAALTDTLILDEEGIYDPNCSNDKLLLGLKGSISEFELQCLKARLQGGRLNKALRGELILPLPVGFAYTDTKAVVLDPDESVVEAIKLIFDIFRREGSITQTAKWLQKQDLRVPSQPRNSRGKLEWSQPHIPRIRNILRNPRYAGCYTFGHRKSQPQPDGRIKQVMQPMSKWLVCIQEHHVGYIDWDEFLRNQETLDRNGSSFKLVQARQTPQREGPALLQSRVLCGRCGLQMRVKYAKPNGRKVWYYACRDDIYRHNIPPCTSTRGEAVDAAVSEFLLATVNPESLALTLAVREYVRTGWLQTSR
ncbi:MAG: recombinase family protein [Bacteroidota bacterium]|nr:recombinase family protein [Bacteroidota bacterium]